MTIRAETDEIETWKKAIAKNNEIETKNQKWENLSWADQERNNLQTPRRKFQNFSLHGKAP